MIENISTYGMYSLMGLLFAAVTWRTLNNVSASMNNRKLQTRSKKEAN
jgi:hypothetical protein